MRYEDLCKDGQAYVDRYIRTNDKTREQAVQEALVQSVIKEYEEGVNYDAQV